MANNILQHSPFGRLEFFVFMQSIWVEFIRSAKHIKTLGPENPVWDKTGT